MSLGAAMLDNLLGMTVTGVFAVLWWLLRNKDDKQQQEFNNFVQSVETYKEVRKLEVEKKFDQLWAKQRDDYAQLIVKHEADVRELAELRERIAREHYVKQELDNKFDKLERAFTDGFKDLGVKFDRLSEAISRRPTTEEHQ